MSQNNLNPKTLNFYQGLMCFPKGLREMFSDSKIFIYSIVPILLGLGVIYFSFYYGWDFSTDIIKKVLKDLFPVWISEKSYIYKTIFWFTNLIAKFVISLALIYISFIIVQIISIPFYTLICERILSKRKVFLKREFELGTWLRLTLRLFVFSLFRMSLFLIFGLIVFVISFIPGLQFLALIYSGYVMAIDCLDYTLEIYEINFARRFGIYFSHFGFFMGITVILLPTMFIPGLTLIFLPITVIGSAVCFAEIRGQDEYEKLIT